MGRLGAFSARQQHVQEKTDSEAKEELEKLKGHLRPHGETGPQDDRDEAGFAVDPDDPLVYVSQEQMKREDYKEYEVVHRRIAIRKKHATDGKVLGTADKGDIIRVFEWDPSRCWRKTHIRLQGGWGNLVEAWIMIRHHELGSLLVPVGGVAEELPPPPVPTASQSAAPAAEVLDSAAAAAAAATAASAAGQSLRLLSSQEVLRVAAEIRAILGGGSSRKSGKRHLSSPLDLLQEGMDDEEAVQEEEEELDLSLHTGPLITPSAKVLVSPQEFLTAVAHGVTTYEVVRRPFTAVRSQPTTDGHIVCTGEYGKRIDTFGSDSSREWRKVFCQTGHEDEVGGTLVAAWMMVAHPTLGPLLRSLEHIAG